MNNTTPRKPGRFYHLTSVAVLGGVVLSAACSDPPFGLAEPQATGGVREDAGKAETGGRAAGGTGGTSDASDTGGAGTGDDGGDRAADDGGVGEASAGGAPGEEDSGSGVSPECVRDSDCVALTCNGEPRCNDDGKCVPGLPCENPAPDHCSVSCVRSGGQASCELRGLDADGDGHFDAACTSGGGDDCDDKSPTTYAGAAEQCDGADNDCDGKADAEDGLPLAGKPTLAHEITGTASLGMAAALEGYGVLEFVTPAMDLDDATAANLLAIDHRGKTTVSPLYGRFRGEPSIAYESSTFVVYENGDPAPTATAHLLRLPFEGGFPTAVAIARPDASGRAFGSPTNSAFTAAVGAVFTTNANSAGRSFLCPAGLGPEPSWSCTTGILAVDSPAALFNPAHSPGAYAWVQASGPLAKDHDLSVFLTTVDAKTNAIRPPTRLQLQSVKADGTLATALRYQALRPQVVTTPTDYLVGWLNDAGLNFARFDTAGKVSCRSIPASGIHSWGWANSLASIHALDETRTDVYAAVVTTDRAPAVVRIDKNCGLGPAIPLATGGAKVALGAYLVNGKPFREAGHPVIATYQNGRIGAAWVEEPNANGLYRVMFRSFGDRLCN